MSVLEKFLQVLDTLDVVVEDALSRAARKLPSTLVLAWNAYHEGVLHTRSIRRRFEVVRSNFKAKSLRFVLLEFRMIY